MLFPMDRSEADSSTNPFKGMGKYQAQPRITCIKANLVDNQAYGGKHSLAYEMK